MKKSIKCYPWLTDVKTGRYFIALGILCMSGGVVAQSPLSQQYGQYLAKARHITKEYATTLKSTLKSALEASGPIGGLKACHVSAPLITSSVGKANKWQVSRTSLKYRNFQNAPTTWEAQVLQSFELQKQRGIDPTTMEFSEIVPVDNTLHFRYMKAIPTAQKPCLACHGKNLKESLNQKILALYPHDKATGFETGDIRGAFSLSVPILESE